MSDSGDVDAVFSILRQHFDSAVYLGISLADFHCTTLRLPFVYWIRWNKAAEVAEQSLENEGRAMQLQGVEVAGIFIRQRSDRDLTLMFFCKP